MGISSKIADKYQVAISEQVKRLLRQKIGCILLQQCSITHNGLGLCDVVAFKAQMFNNPPKLNRNTNDDVR